MLLLACNSSSVIMMWIFVQFVGAYKVFISMGFYKCNVMHSVYSIYDYELSDIEGQFHLTLLLNHEEDVKAESE